MIGEGPRDGLGVAEPTVEGRQLCPQVDDLELHLAAAGVAAVILGGGDQPPSESVPRRDGVNREHAEIADVAADARQ